MLFRLENKQSSPERLTHCGVLEFTAEEGSCYVPFWMMQNLLLEEGGLLDVTNISLPKASFVKLQPQHTDFLEISNPRAVLEHALRNFSCVTKGDVICVPYNNKNYHFMLKEVQPQDAACIIETDCNVDFDAPLGYVDPYANKGSSGNGDGKENQTKQQTSKYSSMQKQTATGVVSNAKVTDDDDSATVGSIRIVNGEVVRPENSEDKIDKSLIAEKTGRTGVQSNSAVPQKAAGVDYWAIHAGGGERIDGKAATPLKDKSGKEVDIRELRAAAAAARMKEASENGAKVEQTTVNRVRKSRIKGKYSTRKHGVESFQGSGKKL